ncbi:hypothetical protein CDD81_7665 [Ophiocordyceps australis]|uniref:ER membrane protein complex subunit 10 n=1 Tax=Ophiocordyceps australis TaxID=1399860 RepID=A0A2C5Y4T9_9HYPO|nr:hypothetical protein CDD81_7665 [Ophiocordyceps australis]
MLLGALASVLCAVAAVNAEVRVVQVYVQPLESPSSWPPSPLAQVSYDFASPSSSYLTAYEAPELLDSTELVRIGFYDAASDHWVSGSTVAAADNFAKGYSPTLALTVDSSGEAISVSCRGVRIDAGHTRDFGPKVILLAEERGAQPVLNKPVVLSPEGKKVEAEQEKTFLQKYWWMIGIGLFLALSGGGGGDK